MGQNRGLKIFFADDCETESHALQVPLTRKELSCDTATKGLKCSKC